MQSTYKTYLLLAILLAPLSSASPVNNSPPKTPPNQGTPAGTVNAPEHALSLPSHDTDHILRIWAKAQKDKLLMVPYTKGGAELWIQFEIEYAMKVDVGIPVQTAINMREQHVYENSALAADWVFKSETGQKGRIVELKVESSTQTGSTLVNNVMEDQKKVSGGLKPEFKDYETSVYALSWKKSTQEKLVADGGMIPLSIPKLQLANGEEVKLFVWDKPKGNGSPKTPSKAVAPKHSRSEEAA